MKILFLIIFIINCVQVGEIKKGGDAQYLTSLVTAKTKNPNLYVTSQEPVIIPTGNTENPMVSSTPGVLSLKYSNDFLKLTINKVLPMAYMSPIVDATDGLIYKISPSLPSGLTMDNQGRISGTPTVAQNSTKYTVTVVDINNKAGSYSFNIVIYSQYTYQDNGDGTVRQNETNLIWQKCTIGKSGNNCGTGASVYYTRNNAINACSALTLAGKQWRLPKLEELMSLIKDTNQFSPFIDSVFFPSSNSNYWTESVYQQSTNKYVMIDFSGPFIRNNEEDPGSVYTRCVSGN